MKCEMCHKKIYVRDNYFGYYDTIHNHGYMMKTCLECGELFKDMGVWADEYLLNLSMSRVALDSIKMGHDEFVEKYKGVMIKPKWK